jgi:hypothetical protein
MGVSTSMIWNSIFERAQFLGASATMPKMTEERKNHYTAIVANALADVAAAGGPPLATSISASGEELTPPSSRSHLSVTPALSSSGEIVTDSGNR